MTNKERKDNRLITEFMGVEWHKEFFKDVSIISPSNISYKFHTSWDWLMLVVEKIESTETENGYYDVRLHVNETKIVDDHFNYIIECHGGNRLENTYQAVVDFINQLTIKTDE
jgi:preprotein translocase subunit SecB